MTTTYKVTTRVIIKRVGSVGSAYLAEHAAAVEEVRQAELEANNKKQDIVLQASIAAENAYLAAFRAATVEQEAIVASSIAADASAAADAAYDHAKRRADAVDQNAADAIYTIKLTGAQRAIVENMLLEAYELACRQADSTTPKLEREANHRAYKFNEILQEVGEYARTE